MKKNFLILYIISCFSGLAFSSSAQNIIIGGGNPASSSKLEIKSSNRGLLIPRIALKSLTDVNTVPTPAVSLLVYNTNAALTYGTGYYSWSGTHWIKLVAAEVAGGDLSGDYPSPTVIKLDSIPLPSVPPTGFDKGKILRYNSSTKQYDLSAPIGSSEMLYAGSLAITGTGDDPPRLVASNDDANLLPLCYGTYNAATNTLSGNTSNVSVSKFSTGIFRITITPASIGLRNFTPAYSVSVLDFGIATCYRESNNTLVVDLWDTAGQLWDRSFQFVVFNR